MTEGLLWDKGFMRQNVQIEFRKIVFGITLFSFLLGGEFYVCGYARGSC